MTGESTERSETARLEALRRYRILDSPAEVEFDDLTNLAAHICGVPTALLTFVDADRQWFKSRVGFANPATPRHLSFCATAMREPDLLVISDAASDPAFAQHPSVVGEPRIRFYAGAPLVSPEGQPLGALCVIDSKPRELDPRQREVLRLLARTVMSRLETRRQAAPPPDGGAPDPAGEKPARDDVLELAADGFIALDRSGRVTYANAKVARLFDTHAKEIVGRQLWTELPACVGEGQFDAYRRAQADGEPATLELFYPTMDRWLENRIYPVPAGMAVFLRDVTVRKRADALAAGQNRLIQLIARGEPLPQALAALVTFVETQSQNMLCSVLLLDDAGTRVRTAAAPSLPAEYSKAIEGQLIGPAAGSCGTAAYRREPVFVDDIATDPLWAHYRTLALPHGLRTCWSTPIFDPSRKVVGTFAIYYRQLKKPTPWHLRLIEVATHIASVAISWDRAQSILRRSEERYRTTLDGILEGCQLIGFDWRYLYLNEAAARHNRRPNHELLGRTMMEAWPGIEGTAVFAMLRRCMTERVALHEEIEFRFADGSSGWYDVRSQPVPEGLFALSIDITERRQADLALRESEARLREAQRDARIGSWRYLADGRFTWSDEMHELFQIPRHETPTYEKALARIHPDDRETKVPFKHALESAALNFQSEFRIVWPDGTTLTVFSRGRINRDTDGRVIDAVGTVQDITERKRAEEELAASHAAMRDLAGRLQTVREEQSTRIAREIHDVLGQQLTGLKLDLAWLKRRIQMCSDEALKVAAAAKLKESAGLLDETLGSVQKIARELRPGTLDRLGLAAALETEARDFAARAGLQCRCEIGAALPRFASEIETGVFRIAQEALTNVARHAQASEVAVTFQEIAGVVALEVRDNGRGFVPGPAGAPRSLGLLGMQERARLLGGTLEIHGAAGGGTSVKLALPRPA